MKRLSICDEVKRQRFLSDNSPIQIKQTNELELKLEKVNSKSADKMNSFLHACHTGNTQNYHNAPIHICTVSTEIIFKGSVHQSIQKKNNFQLENFKSNFSQNNYEQLLYDDVGMKNNFSQMKVLEKQFKSLNLLDQDPDETSDYSDYDFSCSKGSMSDSDSSQDLELNVVDSDEYGIVNSLDLDKSYISKKLSGKQKLKSLQNKFDLGKTLRRFYQVRDECSNSKYSIDICMFINFSKIFKK